MTKFEQFLISKGFEMYTFNSKDMKYSKPKSHVISTMINISHHYIDKVNNKEIIFGLSEFEKPPTLISPRPRAEILLTNRQGKEVIKNEKSDDVMNIILSTKPFEEILEYMFDQSKIFKIENSSNR